MRWFPRWMCLTALAAGMLGHSWAQTARTLTILDTDSIPLPQAMVQIGDQVGFTNSLGVLPLACEGPTTLKVVAVGFETMLVDPFPCHGANLTVVMKPLGLALEEAVVEEARESAGSRPSEIMDAKRIESVPSSTGIPDLLGSLKTSASVGSNVEGQKGLVSRGGNYDQACILVDGFPIMNSTHLFGMLSMFPTGSIANVRLYVNDKPIDQGFTLGSVVQVALNDSFSLAPVHTGKVLSSIIASEALYRHTTDKAFVQLSGRRSNLEVIQGLIDQTINTSNSRQVSAVYGFDDLSAKCAFLLGKHKLESVWLRSTDDVRYDIDFDPSARAYRNATRWRNDMIGAGWKWFVRDRWDVLVRAGWSDYASELRMGQTVPVPAEDGTDTFETESSFDNHIRVRHATLTSNLDWGRLQIIAGIQMQGHWVDPQFTETTNGTSESKPSTGPVGWLNMHALFAQADGELTPWLKGSMGLRRTSWNLDNGASIHWLPRGSLVATLSPSQSLMLHSERSMQGLHLVTLNDFGFVPELWLAPSGSRPVQEAWQTGLRWMFARKATRVSVDGYLRGMTQLLEFQPGVNFDQGLNELLSQDLAYGGRGAVYGVEVASHHEWRRMTLDVAYAHGRSSRMFETLNGGRPFPFTFDIRHDATCALRWDVSETWTFSCMNVFATGRWLDINTERVPLGMTNPAFGSDVAWTSYALHNNRNGYQLGHIHRLDVAATWKKRFTPGTFQVQLGVYNLTNRVNPYATIWAETEDGEPFIDEIGLIPLLPNASLSFEWN